MNTLNYAGKTYYIADPFEESFWKDDEGNINFIDVEGIHYTLVGKFYLSSIKYDCLDIIEDTTTLILSKNKQWLSSKN